MGQTISFKRPDGQSVQGYLAEPAGGSGPGVVVIQEWWGLNAQIKGVADHMAAAGYRALVPDLYRGKVTVEAKEAEHLMTNLNFGDAAGQDVRGGVQHAGDLSRGEVGGRQQVLGVHRGTPLGFPEPLRLHEATAFLGAASIATPSLPSVSWSWTLTAWSAAVGRFLPT